MCRFVISVLLSIIVSACSGKEVQTLAPLSAPNLGISKEVLAELRSVFKEPDPEKPLIDRTFAGKIKPAINKWLNYYDLNIKDFVFDKEIILNLNKLRNDTTYPYYGKFEKEDDIYNPVLYDYSPDKLRYIDLVAATGVNVENGKYYYRGSDDCQQLGLYDRKEKSYVMFSFRGIHEFADAIFWIDNDTFALVGYNTMDYPIGWYALEIYDLKNDICRSYILREKYEEEESYGIAEMKARGIKIE